MLREAPLLDLRDGRQAFAGGDARRGGQRVGSAVRAAAGISRGRFFDCPRIPIVQRHVQGLSEPVIKSGGGVGRTARTNSGFGHRAPGTSGGAPVARES